MNRVTGFSIAEEPVATGLTLDTSLEGREYGVFLGCCLRPWRRAFPLVELLRDESILDGARDARDEHPELFEA
jgi:hypothetical protein